MVSVIKRRRNQTRGTSYTSTLCLILVVAIFCLGGIAALFAQRAAEAKEAEKARALQVEAELAAQQVVDFIQPAISTTLELAIAIEKARADGVGRDKIRRLAVPRLQRRPEHFGVAVVFEPNGYDGKDAKFAGVAPEQNEEGRFVAYYYNNGEAPVGIDHLVMTIQSGIAGWYLEPLHNKRARLETPYTYPIHGIDTLMTTVSVPLLAEGRAFGVTTVDIRLPDFVNRVRSLVPGGTGEVALLSAAEIWIVHPDNENIGRDLLQPRPAFTDPLGNVLAANAYQGYRSGAQTTFYRYHPKGTAIEYVLVPVKFAGVPETWTLFFRIPFEQADQGIGRAVLMPLAIAIAAFMLGVALAMSLDRSRLAARRQHTRARSSVVAQKRRSTSTVQRR